MTNPTMEIDQSKVGWAQQTIMWISRAVTFLIYLYVLFVEIILLLGFLLLLGGANPSSSFVEWVYRSLDRAMKPFRGIFASDRARSDGQRRAVGLRHVGALCDDHVRHPGDRRLDAARLVERTSRSDSTGKTRNTAVSRSSARPSPVRSRTMTASAPVAPETPTDNS